MNPQQPHWARKTQRRLQRMCPDLQALTPVPALALALALGPVPVRAQALTPQALQAAGMAVQTLPTQAPDFHPQHKGARQPFRAASDKAYGLGLEGHWHQG